MQPESPTTPHVLSQYLWPSVAGILAILGYIGGWFTRRRREPIELAKLSAETDKLNAETRSVDAATHTSLIQAAATALAKAERLQDVCDHWERKAEALQRQVDLLNIEVASTDQQMRRLHGFIQSKGWHYSDYDTPKRID